MRGGHVAGAIACLAAVGLLAGGCAIRDIRAEARAYQLRATLKGSVRTSEPSTHPLVVVLAKIGEGDEIFIAGSYTVPGQRGRKEGDPPGGSWSFALDPGRYQLGAFEDVSEDLVYRPGEPVLRIRGSPIYELSDGEVVDGVELVIRPGDRAEGPFDVMAELEAVRAHAPEEQLRATADLFAAVGEVLSLDDPRFD
jgi:hypothetical protein